MLRSETNGPDRRERISLALARVKVLHRFGFVVDPDSCNTNGNETRLTSESLKSKQG